MLPEIVAQWQAYARSLHPMSQTIYSLKGCHQLRGPEKPADSCVAVKSEVFCAPVCVFDLLSVGL